MNKYGKVELQLHGFLAFVIDRDEGLACGYDRCIAVLEEPRHALDRRLGGHHSRSFNCGNEFLVMLGVKRRILGHTIRNLTTTLAGLCGLQRTVDGN